MPSTKTETKSPTPNPNKNLIPFNQMPIQRAREIQSLGGKKSAQARKRRKDLKSAMKILLELPVTDEEILQEISDLGLAETEITNSMRMLVGLFKNACKGDVSAIKEVRNIIGDERKTSLEMSEMKIKTENAKLQLQRLKENNSDETYGFGVVLMPQPEEIPTDEVIVDD